MKFDILTLFPEMFKGPLSESIIKRAQDKGLIEINYYNIRDFATDKHKTVDDTPYGGGKGMILKIDVMDRAIKSITQPIPLLDKERLGEVNGNNKSHRTILLTPTGQRFNQEKAIELSKYDNIILICGHYEGFDERVRQHLVDEEISIGDFVLTGGEIPAMCIIDAVSRMVPGVLSVGSSDEETFMQKDKDGNYLKEYPQYTRPVEYNGWSVPEVLQSGDHKKIADWRNDMRIN